MKMMKLKGEFMKKLNLLIKAAAVKNSKVKCEISKVNSEVSGEKEAPVRPLVMIAHKQKGQMY